LPSLRDIRARIRSVQNTRKITKAYQVVAATKLRRAQQAGDVRPDVGIADVAALMTGIGYADPSVTPTQRSRCVSLACDSLLTRARSVLPQRSADKPPADQHC